MVRVAKNSRVERRYPMSVERPAIAVVMAIAIPAIYMTAAAAPVVHQQSEHAAGGLQGQVSSRSVGAPTEAHVSASVRTDPAMPPAPADSGVSHSGPPPTQPSGPVPPTQAAPTPPVSPAPEDEDSGIYHEQGFSYTYGFDPAPRGGIYTNGERLFPFHSEPKQARVKISSSFMLGQRIDPVSVGNRIAPLSTPQLSQSRNCSFLPLIITGSHPMPRT
jgi:hypothetical protein